MQDVLNDFARLLDLRFGKEVPTTEDCIRYTFFYSLAVLHGVTPDKVILESRHEQADGRAEIDIVATLDDAKRLAVEFKFHRQAPQARTAVPRPQHAGNLFRDVFRLATLPGADLQRWVVYVTDSVMATYFRNARNYFGDFFDLAEGQVFDVPPDFGEGRSTTFSRVAGKTVAAQLLCHMSRQLANGYWLRVFEVTPTSVSEQPSSD